MEFSSSADLNIVKNALFMGVISQILVFIGYLLSTMSFFILDDVNVISTDLLLDVVNDLIQSFFFFLALMLAISLTSTSLLDRDDKIAILTQRRSQLLFFIFLVLINLSSLLFVVFTELGTISFFAHDHYFGFPVSIFYSSMAFQYPSVITFAYYFLLFRVFFISVIQFFLVYILLYFYAKRSEGMIYSNNPNKTGPKSRSDSSSISHKYLIIFIFLYLYLILMINASFRRYLVLIIDEEVSFILVTHYKNLLLGLELIAFVVAVLVIPLFFSRDKFLTLFSSTRSIFLFISMIVATRLIITIIVAFSSIPLDSVFFSSLLEFPVTNMLLIIHTTPITDPLSLLFFILQELVYLYFLSTALVSAILMIYPDKINLDRLDEDPDALLYAKNNVDTQ